MNIVFTIARLLLGLIFLVLGVNGFLFFLPSPPPPAGIAGQFFGVLVSSHFSYLVFGVQVLCGLLLLINRFVPLALVILAAVIANILNFHILMWPSALVPMPILVTILWFIVAWSRRSDFSVLLSAKS